MDRDALASWLDAYGRAWETKDGDGAVALFSQDCEYIETPFSEPMLGLDAVRAYWDITASQQDIRFEHEVLAAEGERGIAWWRATFTRVPEGVPVVLDGIFVLDFADDGRCRRLREWWHMG